MEPTKDIVYHIPQNLINNVFLFLEGLNCRYCFEAFLITLSEHENLDVISVGGKLMKNANLHIGASVVNQLAGVKADLCILGANAFSAEEGLTDMDWEIVQVKMALIRSARKVAVISISEKLNSVKWLNICAANQIHYLVTELDPQDSSLLSYANKNITLL